MQEGEAEKQKAYVAKCRLPCPVTEDMLERLGAMKDVVLQQRTPTRVEQRRAMLVSARQETSSLDKSSIMLMTCKVCKQ
jgi:tRNA U54 and U55 pseudouridine synthase Pus10